MTYRLAVNKTDEVDWSQVGARLRGAEIAALVDPACHDLPAGCQGVVLLGTAEPAVDVLERWLATGKHMLLAVEPYLEVAQLRSLSAAAHAAGATFSLANVDNYRPSRRMIQQQLGEKLGTVAMVRIHRWETTATVRREPLGLPGPLVRDLEQVLWLTGRRAERVFALAQPAAKANSSTGRFVQVHLGFDHGMALIDYDSRLPEGAGYQSLSVIGTLGAAYADDQRNAQLVFQGGPPQGLVAGEGCVPVANMVQSLVDHLHGTVQPAAQPTTWFDALELVGAVKRSLESGQAVSLEKQ